MGSDSINLVRGQLGERIAELQSRVPSLKPADIAARMDAIRAMAAEHGMAALEGLADWSAHHAMMPGHKVATACCLEHMEEALLSDSAADRQTILAALALRLH
jgi:NADH:ubiquinone oxidoreductase subunit B-like Fe-S oxidoreductase